uniref:ER membrane protein complex subunit 1 n=1 Tax=Hanusia phi TaxID=3032 RepID=A0A7S0E1R2_9CRYP|mmetsp:Transcript_14029/g.32303  ORF Transcript_14029/g.32303 Transcript_14029/m.32303 type:complete len:974 (-) Transcript_14029:73-2994(-)
MLARLSFFFLSVFVCLPFASSLYEDQAGLNDFHVQNIGKPTSLLFHPDPHKRRLFFATDLNVIGALDSKHGTILWRHSLGNEEINAIEYSGRFLASLSGRGKIVRVWNAADGTLVWDQSTQSETDDSRRDMKFSIRFTDVNGGDAEELIVATGNMVQMYSASNGRKMWEWKSKKNNVKDLEILHSDAKSLHVVAVDSNKVDREPMLAKISTKDGSSLSDFGKAIEGATKCDSLSSNYAGILACLQSSAGSVHFFKAETGKRWTSSVATQGSNEAISVELLKNHEMMIVRYVNQAAVLASLDANAVKVFHTFEGQPGSLISYGSDKNGDVLVAQAQPTSKGLELKSFHLKTQEVVTHEFPSSIWSKEENGGIEMMAMNPYVRKDGSGGLRVLMLSENYAMTLFQQGSVLWERHESLAYISETEMVDLPLPALSHNELLDENVINSLNPISRLVRRCIADLSDLIDFILKSPQLQTGPSTRQRAAWDGVGVSLQHDMSGDRFGFNKILVFITAPGMVVGMHSQTGKIVWKKFYGNDAILERFFLTKATSPDGKLECLVLGRSKQNSGHTFVAWLQPLTGAEISRKVLPVKTVQASLVPLLTEKHAYMVMLMDSARKVHLLPDTAKTREAFSKRSSRIVLYLVDKERSAIDGYGIREMRGEVIWTVAFPKGEKLLTLSAQRMNEAIRSAGRVLGNRAVLLKYLNKNLLAVATGTQERNERVGQADPVVRVYLIDTVIGAIVHTASHKDATGPVEIVQSENVVIYTLWNNKKQRNEMAVLELYENTKKEILTAGEMMMYNDSKTTYTSHGLDKPRVLSQTYITHTAVKTMAVAHTMHGITTKNVIAALASDQILSIDKKLLDPRRPVGKPSPDDMEEGLMPYSPFLPVMPTAVLSYNRTILQLRKIVVAPARIESTCLMVAVGADVFFSRVTPAKAFDCLGDDFNYASLVLSTLALALLSWAVSWFQAKRELAQAWK